MTNGEGVASKTLEFVENAIAFLFEEIRYELDDTVIYSGRGVSLVSILKGYLP